MTAVETRAMSIEEIQAALEAIVAGIRDEEGNDVRPLTDEEAARYEELEGKLQTTQRHQGILERHKAYKAVVRNDLHVNVTGSENQEDRAFEQYLRTGNAPAELAQYRAQSEGTNSAGGYLVPSGFRQKLVERMKQFGGIANYAETITTSEGNALPYPTVDDTSNVGEIVAEGGTFAAGADLVFGTRSLSAYKYMAGGAGNLPLKVSWELLQDSAFDVPSFLARKLGERIARVQAVHWATGTGTGQPQGIVTPITTSGTIGTLALSDLVATILFLDPAYRANAKWLMNDATYGTIMGLNDSTGRPLLTGVNDGIAGDITRPRLLGYEVVIDQAMPAKATGAKFLAFGDINEAYVIRRVKDITLVTLNELYAANGQTGFMAWARADGAVQNPNAIVVRTGA
jgi:HK97 family phage major capsid protein